MDSSGRTKNLSAADRNASSSSTRCRIAVSSEHAAARYAHCAPGLSRRLAASNNSSSRWIEKCSLTQKGRVPFKDAP